MLTDHGPQPPSDPPRPARRRGRRLRGLRLRGLSLRGAVRLAGEAMITLGLVTLLFAGYEIWGKAAIVNAHQRELDAQLTQQWAAPTSTPQAGAGIGPAPDRPLAPPPGWAIARLYLPTLHKHWVVVEGVDPGDLGYAPGHYPKSAQPGHLGNFAVAGHRSPAIFWDLDKVRDGDAVVVETRSTFFVYRVTQVHVVDPTEVEEVAPVPGHPHATPTHAVLTLTTCNPRWDNYQRLVVHATLDHSQPRSAGPPPETRES